MARIPIRQSYFTSIVWSMLLALHLSTGNAAAQGAMTNGDNHAGTISGPGELDLWTFTASEGRAFDQHWRGRQRHALRAVDSVAGAEQHDHPVG